LHGTPSFYSRIDVYTLRIFARFQSKIKKPFPFYNEEKADHSYTFSPLIYQVSTLQQKCAGCRTS